MGNAPAEDGNEETVLDNSQVKKPKKQGKVKASRNRKASGCKTEHQCRVGEGAVCRCRQRSTLWSPITRFAQQRCLPVSSIIERALGAHSAARRSSCMQQAKLSSLK